MPGGLEPISRPLLYSRTAVSLPCDQVLQTIAALETLDDVGDGMVCLPLPMSV